MFNIEAREYGFKLTFGGKINAVEMNKWLSISEKILETHDEKFCVFVDMRTLQPLSNDVKIIMEKGQSFYKDKGLQRSVVILNNPATTMQFKHIAIGTGIYKWERYIDSSNNPDWESAGLDWIMRSIDPDITAKQSQL